MDVIGALSGLASKESKEERGNWFNGGTSSPSKTADLVRSVHYGGNSKVRLVGAFAHRNSKHERLNVCVHRFECSSHCVQESAFTRWLY